MTADFQDFVSILIDKIETDGGGDNGYQNDENNQYVKSCGVKVGTVWGVTAQEWEKIYKKIYGKSACISAEWLKNTATREMAIQYHYFPDVWENQGYSKIKSKYVANILADVFVQSYTRSYLNARKVLNKMGEKLSENSTMINSALINAINRQIEKDEDLLIKLLKEERGKDGWAKRINKYPNRPGATNVYGTCKAPKGSNFSAQYKVDKDGEINIEDDDCTTEEAAEHRSKNKSTFTDKIKDYWSRVKGGLDFSTGLWKQDIGYTTSFVIGVGLIGFFVYKLIKK